MKKRSLSALYIPCWIDGLSKLSGSVKVRAEWVCRYWDGAEVYNGTQSFGEHDLYVFQKAYLGSRAQKWIHQLAAMRENGHKIKLAFDLCDPDFLYDEHRQRMLSVLPLFDFAVSPTLPLAKWLSQYLPAYVIPDRIDFAEINEITESERTYPHKPRLVWSGYEGHIGALYGLMSTIEELGLSLTVRSIQRAIPFQDFWKQIASYDILLNPRPSVGPNRYKSDNKTIIAWRLGIPVARTPDELRKLLDVQARVAEIQQRRAEVAAEWSVEKSVQQWHDITEGVVESIRPKRIDGPSMGQSIMVPTIGGATGGIGWSVVGPTDSIGGAND